MIENLEAAVDWLRETGLPESTLAVTWYGGPSVEVVIYPQFSHEVDTSDLWDLPAEEREAERERRFRDHAAEIRRQIGGSWDKVTVGRGMNLTRRVDLPDGAVLSLTLVPPNGTCKQVVVGEREVEKEVVLTPATHRVEKVLEPVYEWDCGPLLGDPEEASS